MKYASIGRAKTMAKLANDPITGPAHYGGDACRRAEAAMLGPDCYIIPEGCDRPLSPQAIHWWCSAFEYLWRWVHKNGVDDLRKCKQCIDFLIEEVGE